MGSIPFRLALRQKIEDRVWMESTEISQNQSTPRKILLGYDIKHLRLL